MKKGMKAASREAYWLGHLRACEAGGGTLAGYAMARGVSIGALYQAKRRLRERGLWPGGADAVGVSGFVRVMPAAEEAVPARGEVYRLTLRNGVVVELAGGELGAVLSAASRLS